MNKVASDRFVTMHRKRVLSEILNYVNSNSDMTICESDDGVLLSIKHSNDDNYLGAAEFYKAEEYRGPENKKVEQLLLKFAKINRTRIIDELLKD